MKKIFFVIHELTVGGAEKVVVNVMNNIDRDKYEIHLIIFRNIGELKEELKDDIIIHDLKVDSVKKGAFLLYRLIKNEHPDIVFSGIAHVNLMLAMMIPFLPKGIRYIARETSIVSKRDEKNNFYKILYRFFYNNFDIIVCQSYYMKNDLEINFHINQEKIVVINNPVNIGKIRELASTNENLFNKKYFNLLAVGGLRPEKGFDLLLQAISELDKRFFLTIIGDGQERKKLEQFAKELKISDRVRFLGFKSNPYPYMAQADLMVLSSRYEGFPNVVLEANACGIPVVAFNCPGGTGEIIKNGINGFLVKCKDINELAKMIKKASVFRWDKDKIIKYIEQRYSLDEIVNKYEKIF